MLFLFIFDFVVVVAAGPNKAPLSSTRTTLGLAGASLGHTGPTALIFMGADEIHQEVHHQRACATLLGFVMSFALF